MSEYDERPVDNRTSENEEKAFQAGERGLYDLEQGIDRADDGLNKARDIFDKGKEYRDKLRERKNKNKDIEDENPLKDKSKDNNKANKDNSLSKNTDNSNTPVKNENGLKNPFKLSNAEKGEAEKKGIEAGKNGGEKGRRLGSKISKQTQKGAETGAKEGAKEAGKKGVETGTKAAAEGAKTAATTTAETTATAGEGALAASAPVLLYILIAVAIVIIIVTIFVAIFAVISSVKGEELLSSIKNDKITTEAEEISYIFNSFTKTSNDYERTSYLSKYNKIIDNGYELALFSVWKKVAINSYYANVNTYGKDVKDNMIYFSGSKNKSKWISCNSVIDYVYDQRVGQFYLKRKKSSYEQTDFRTNGFYNANSYVVGEKENKENNKQDTELHYHYANNIIKMCIDTFVDKRTHSIIASPDDFLSEYKKIKKEKNKNYFKGKKKSEILEECKKYQINKALKNLEGKTSLLEQCVVKEEKVNEKATEPKESKKSKTNKKTQIKKKKTIISEPSKKTTKKNNNNKNSSDTSKTKKANRTDKLMENENLKYYISEYIYKEKNKQRIWKYNQKTHKLDKSYKKDIFNIMDEFLAEKESSQGDASEIVALARKQVGNGGSKYWTGMGQPPNQWCAMFVGWLIKNSGIKPSEVGWAASCTSWIRNAMPKKIYHPKYDNYSPQKGDVVFFHYYNDGFLANHVGIIEKVSGSTIYTIEGNSGGGGSIYSTKVLKHQYTNWKTSSISGFISMGKFYTSSDSSVGANQSCKSLKPAVIDKKFKGHTVKLTPTTRSQIEKLVTNENDNNGYVGCLLVAQCLRDAIYRAHTSDCKKGKPYKGNAASEFTYEANYSGAASANAKKAVKYIFDKGGYAVQHRILYFYSPVICRNRGQGKQWHETQLFVVQHGKPSDYHRYFDAR